MAKAKKTLSLVMIAIFTTFIVLSGIPASAVTKAAATKQIKSATALVVKSEAAVKVKNFNYKTAQTAETTAVKQVNVIRTYGKVYAKTYTALAKRIAAVQKKINARKVAVAKAAKPKIIPSASTVAAKDLAAAQTAVGNAEDLTNTDTYDLVGSDTDLQNAQDAVTSALEAVVKLDNNSADYKGLMARIDAANEKIVKAMEDRDAAAAAIQAQKDEADAVAAAETAVKAVETAPLATAADLAAALDLGKTAADAVSKVTEPDKAADFTARLKAVADKGTALQTALDKAAADAKAAADKAAADAAAKLPANLVSVSAVDGTITVTFNKKPLTTPVLADLTVTKSVNGTTAAAVTPTTLTVTNDTTVTLAVPAVAATSVDQAVVYTVGYTTGAAVSAVAYTVPKNTFAVSSVMAVNSASTDDLTVKVESGAKLQVTFNSAVDTTTVTNTNFVLTQGTQIVAATLSTSADGKVVTVTPSVAMTIAKQYTLTVGTAVKGVNTLALSAASASTFTVADTFAVSGLAVNGTAVDNYVTVVNPLVVTFNKAIDASTVNTGNIKLYNVTDGVYVPFTTAELTQPSSTTVRVAPTAGDGYIVGKQYKFTINGVKALDGSTVVAYTKNYGYAAQQNSAPVVTAPSAHVQNSFNGIASKMIAYCTSGAAPAPLQLESPMKATVTFTQPMDATTLTANNFYIAKADANNVEIANTKVAGTVTYDAGSYTATFVPSADLAEGTAYVAVITTNVKDSSGVPTIAQSTPFSTDDFTSPTIKSTSIDSGALVSADSNITIHFSEPMQPANFGALTVQAPVPPATTADFDGTHAIKVINVGTGAVVGDGNMTVDTSFATDATDPRITIHRPAGNWVQNTNYEIVINGYQAGEANLVPCDKIAGIGTKIHGNMLVGDQTFYFTTQAPSAPTIAAVKATMTADGAYATSPSTALSTTATTYGVSNIATAAANDLFTIKYNSTMAAAAAAGQYTIYVDANGDGAYAAGETFNLTNANVALGSDGVTVTITPTAGLLAALKTATPVIGKLVIHENAVVDQYNTAMTSSAADLTYNFVTGSGPAYVTPVAEAGVTVAQAKYVTGVHEDEPIKIVFDQQVDYTTVNTTNIKVTDPTGAVVTGTFYSDAAEAHSVSSNTTTVYFAPDNNLTSNAIYTVSVTNGVKNALGSTSSPYSYTFKVRNTTAPAPVVALPTTPDGAATVTYNVGMLADGSAHAVDNAANYVVKVNNVATNAFTVVYDSDANVSTVRLDTVLNDGDVLYVGVNPGLAGTNGTASPSSVSKEAQIANPNAITKFGVTAAKYDAANKILTLTMDRPVAVVNLHGALVFTDFTFANANVVATNFVAASISSDGLTITVVLKDDTATPSYLGLAPTVSTIALNTATIKFMKSGDAANIPTGVLDNATDTIAAK